MSDDTVKRFLIFQGTVELEGGRPGSAYRVAEGEDTGGSADDFWSFPSVLFKKPRKRQWSPGTVIEADCGLDDDGKVTSADIKGARPVGRWNHDLSIELCAMERTYEKGQDSKREANRQHDLEALSPFRKAYFGLPTRRRAALVASVVAYIMGVGKER